jgi:isopropylmalate/homocitrate/citramalate synthase
MKIFDVTLRDGIQSRTFINNFVKLRVLNNIIKSGIKDIEVTSFSKLPQFNNRDEFINSIPNHKNIKYYGLVANKKGYELFKKQDKIKGLSLITSVNNEFNIKNVGKNVQEQLHETISIIKQSKFELENVKNRIYISCCFGYNNSIIDYPVVDMVEELLDHGSDEVVISDTTGVCNFFSLYDMYEKLDLYKESIAFHFHGKDSISHINFLDSKGFQTFDASLVDGYCPSSTTKEGNVNTIDLIQFNKTLNYDYLQNAKKILEDELN